MKPSRLLVILAFALPAAYAGEFKVEKKPFKSTVEFEGSFLSAEAHIMKIDPKVWSDFTIQELVAQGGVVKKGDPIVVLDTEGIERQLADDADATMARKTALKGSELELANLGRHPAAACASRRRSTGGSASAMDAQQGCALHTAIT